MRTAWTRWALRAVSAVSAAAVAGCAGSDPGSPGPDDPYPGVNSVPRDRGVWQQLLSDHGKIRRTLRHSEKDGVGIVESLTESDDPEVAELIIDHAKSMQARMKVGATVRVWDPVFKDLFEKHKSVTLEVTPTGKGVRIVETSADPEAIALMRSHAMGVSAFVRAGHAISGDETPRLAVGGPLPPDEVAIGGVPHRFLLSHPTPEQLAVLGSQGVERILNLRKPEEHKDYDEAGAAAAAGATYCNLPFNGAAELTDEVLAATRAEYAAATKNGIVIAAHCRTGNRLGPGLAAYLALDLKLDVERAIAAAKAVGMTDPSYEAIARRYIERAKN
jgi:protein tyrosine phosphatase (PTP) superfamily phosphohydrolase (DUF442 family)